MAEVVSVAQHKPMRRTVSDDWHDLVSFHLLGCHTLPRQGNVIYHCSVSQVILSVPDHHCPFRGSCRRPSLLCFSRTSVWSPGIFTCLVSYNRLSVILATPIVSLRSFGFCLSHYSCLYFLLYIYSLFLMLSDNLLWTQIVAHHVDVKQEEHWQNNPLIQPNNSRM